MTCSALSRRAAALLLALALAVGAHGAEPTKAAQDEAKPIFAEAQQAYQLGKFEDAIARYEKVYQLTNHPSLLFNLAQCHRQLGNFERAAFFYERYLASARAPIPNEQLARDLLAEMEQKRDQKAAEDKLAAEARAKVEAEAAAAERARQEEEGRRLAQKVPEAKPVTSQPWFWVAVVGGAAVVVGGTVAIAAAAGSRPAGPDTSLGTIQF
jgi:tetratricopeptide (TPR) repeat protein